MLVFDEMSLCCVLKERTCVLVKELERPDRIIRHGSWGFSPETAM